MHVAMVSADFPPEVVGGAELQCLALSRALVRRGVEVTILVSTRGEPRIDDEDGVRVVRLHARYSPQLGGRRLGASVRWGRAVYQWVQAAPSPPDLLHAHQAKLNAFWATRAATRAGIPSVVKVGTAGPQFDLARLRARRGGYGRLAARSIVRRADRWVAISSEVAGRLRADGIPPERIVDIPNGVVPLRSAPPERAAVEEARKTLGLGAGDRLVTFVGRLVPMKDPVLLLDVWPEVVERVPDARLHLLGTGPLERDLIEQAERGGADPTITFTGAVRNVADHLRAAEVFVLPSLSEGLSNALLEAMSAGVVVVASRVSGTVDVIEHRRNGLLVEPGDRQALLDSLLDVLIDPDSARPLALEAHADALNRYSIGAVADRYVQLYSEILDEAAPTAAPP